VDADAELTRIPPQRVDLSPRHRVRDRLVDVQRRRVVVLCCQREIRTANGPTGLPQTIEGLRAGHLVNEMQIDEEQVGLTVSGSYDVVVPHLLAQCLAHGDWSLLIPVPTICHAGAQLIPATDKLIFALAFQHPRRQYQGMDNSSGVGVLDKAALVLSALETGPTTLAGLVAATGLARPTAHRLAVALEHHRLVSRDLQGRFILGPRLGELASAAGEDRLLATAGPVLARLRDITGESAQMFRRQGDYRVCVATAERMSGLRDSVPVGTQLTMSAGSAAQVLLAWEEPDRMQRGLRGSRYSAVALAAVRRRGWAHSVGEREPGVASVSAPVRSPSGKVIAAVSVSGPIERLSRQPGRLHAPAVIAAAERLSEVLRRSGGE
jgi:DNA-binding IclR family transcriptional regulator